MYRGASVAARQAERREKLIEAAIQVIGTVGYHHATVRAICNEAGLTERYFYESFENSEQLLCTVYDHLIGRLQAQTLAALARSEKSPEAMAKAALRVYFEFNRDPLLARITLFEVLGVSPAVDKRYRKAMDDFAQLIGNVSKSLYPGRAFEALDEALLTSGMVGAVVQMTMRWVLGGYQQSLAMVVRNAHAIFNAVNRQLLAPVQRG